MSYITSEPELLVAYESLISNTPGLRIRDAAKQLSTTEAQILAAQITRNTVKRLKIDQPSKFLDDLSKIGHVMVLNRNDASVLESKGTINPTQNHGPHIGVVIGTIELRLFWNHWKSAFYVEAPSKDKILKSIQVFDSSGAAVIKIYLQDESKNDLLVSFVNDNLSDNQETQQSIEPLKIPKFNDTYDKTILLEDWSKLQDTHDFYMMLVKHGISRLEAMKAGEDRFTRQIHSKESVLSLMKKMAETKIPSMLFVNNNGCVHIYEGEISNIVEFQGWYNVMDERVNLHVDMNLINSIWLVKKPTSDGLIHSIELFDHTNELSLQLFSYRKPGSPENPLWAELLSEF